jgi:Ras-related protein Rab-32
MEQEHKNILHKILVVGDLGVGKTSFMKRWVHGIFSIHYKSTIGVDFALKIVKIDDETTLRLQCWDIGGKERFGDMTRIHYKEATAAFVFADATRQTTIDATVKWKQDLEAKADPDVSKRIILILAKSDLLPEDKPNYDAFCQEHGFHSWMYISSKDVTGTKEAGNAMVNLCKDIPELPSITASLKRNKEEELTTCEKKPEDPEEKAKREKEWEERRDKYEKEALKRRTEKFVNELIEAIVMSITGLIKHDVSKEKIIVGLWFTYFNFYSKERDIDHEDESYKIIDEIHNEIVSGKSNETKVDIIMSRILTFKKYQFIGEEDEEED